MRKKYSWSDEMVPDVDETDIELGKVQRGVQHMHAYQWFSSPSLIDKRPPVTVSITIDTPEKLAYLMDVPVEELPMCARLSHFAKAFCGRHADINFNVHLIYNKSDFKREFPEYA